MLPSQAGHTHPRSVHHLPVPPPPAGGAQRGQGCGRVAAEAEPPGGGAGGAGAHPAVRSAWRGGCGERRGVHGRTHRSLLFQPPATLCAVQSMLCPLPACRPTIETIAAMMKVGCHAAADCHHLLLLLPLPAADCCCSCQLLIASAAPPCSLPPPPRWPRLRASRQRCRCGTSASWPWTQPRSWPARTSASGWRRRCSGSQTTTSRRYKWEVVGGLRELAATSCTLPGATVAPPAASPIPQIDGMVAKKEKSIKIHDS